jgi:hypothetical protein
VLPGTNNTGICLASIHDAVSSAVSYFTTLTGCNNYVLTIGSGSSTAPLSVDLTLDTSLAGTAAWKPDREVMTTYEKKSGTGANGCVPSGGLPQQGCLTIQGANGSTSYVSQGGANSSSGYTTLITDPTFAYVKGEFSSHLLFQNMTLIQPIQTAFEGTPATTNGTVSAGGTVVLYYSSNGTTTSTHGTFATLTLDVVQGPNTPIEDPNAFVAIASGGAGYPANSSAVTLTLQNVGLPNSSCTGNTVLVVSTNVSGVVAPTTAVPTGIQNVLSPGACSTYPTSPAPITSTWAGGTATQNATFYVAYLPTPMAAWIDDYNAVLDNSQNVFSAYIEAYTNTSQPAVVQVAESHPGTLVLPFTGWGEPRFGTLEMPLPPSQDSTLPNRWTLTFSSPTSVDPMPTYLVDPANVSCVHYDSGQAFEFLDTSNVGGTLYNGASDIIVNNITMMGTARSIFRGTTGVQVLNTTVARGANLANGNAPCYGSQAGGPQIGFQTQGPITYGNTVNNFVSTGALDDALAVFNDVGGTQSYPQSTINASSFMDAGYRSINLYNDPSITCIPNTSGGAVPSGCPTPTTYLSPATVTYTSVVDCNSNAVQCPVTYTSKTYP